MGVTIHFEGKLKSEEDFNKVMEIATNFAVSNNMTHNYFEDENKILGRVKDEEEWEYEGPTKGLFIQPDDNTEYLNLEFDKDLYVQEFCKTQFADPSVHILIVDLLRQIQPHFEKLNVEDEGEYWETSDLIKLQANMDACFEMMEEAREENKDLIGPILTEHGRIIDLMDDAGDEEDEESTNEN